MQYIFVTYVIYATYILHVTPPLLGYFYKIRLMPSDQSPSPLTVHVVNERPLYLVSILQLLGGLGKFLKLFYSLYALYYQPKYLAQESKKL